MSLPLLNLPIDSKTLKVRILRSEKNANEKNKRMMRRLWKEPWFVEYRQALERYRKGRGTRPKYPTTKVERIEQLVDAEMRRKYPGYTRAVFGELELEAILISLSSAPDDQWRHALGGEGVAEGLGDGTEERHPAPCAVNGVAFRSAHGGWRSVATEPSQLPVETTCDEFGDSDHQRTRRIQLWEHNVREDAPDLSGRALHVGNWLHF
jgi:hypothetical protein